MPPSSGTEGGAGAGAGSRGLGGALSYLLSGRRSENRLADQQEAGSASVNLEAIIHNFDENDDDNDNDDQDQDHDHDYDQAGGGGAGERAAEAEPTIASRSDSPSLTSFSNAQQVSQQSTSNYISAKELHSSRRSNSRAAIDQGGNHDEDTTSFYSALQDVFPLCDDDQLKCSPLLYSADYNDRDKMLPQSHFQIFWSDVRYQIKPKLTWTDLSSFCERPIKACYDRLEAVFCCSHIRNYNCSRHHNSQSEADNLGALFQKKPVTILDDISGSFKSGEITAILGPSGAGKTSLLNFLSRRREEGYSGRLYVDNANRRLKISTIPQQDVLPEYLTVRENLVIASRLRNPSSSFDHASNIGRVAGLLGLKDCLDTRTKKISGGQHKRLSIAQELLFHPDILILDEPTSGLDSLTCYRTVSVLKNLVKSTEMSKMNPIAIVMTIHQPEQEVFDLFDKIYVVASGGRAIYHGPPNGCTSFTAAHTGLKMPEDDYNPASFMIEIASGEFGEEPLQALEQQVRHEFKLHQQQQGQADEAKSQQLNHSLSPNQDAAEQPPPLGRSPTMNSLSIRSANSAGAGSNLTSKIKLKLYQQGHKLKGTQKSPPAIYIDPRIAKGSSLKKTHFWSKTRTLTERTFLSMVRDPKQLIARVAFSIFLPVGLYMMLGDSPGKETGCPKYITRFQLKDIVLDMNTIDKKVQSTILLNLENLAMFFTLIYAMVTASAGIATLSFSLDMQRSLKEYYNGWFSMPSYIIARQLTDMPLDIILPIVTMGIAYPITNQAAYYGMPDTYRALIASGAIILGCMIGQTIGMTIGMLYMGHISTALFAAQAFSLPFVFLSGFVVRTKEMSSFVYGLSFVSYFRHALDLTMLARYGYGACPCDPANISDRPPEMLGVPAKLKTFTDFWAATSSDSSDEELTTLATPHNATGALTTVAPEETNRDLFSMFATQISLFNTFGVPIKSCADLKPFVLFDASLSESSAPRAVISLVISLIVVKLLLFMTVRLMIRFKTSL